MCDKAIILPNRDDLTRKFVVLLLLLSRLCRIKKRKYIQEFRLSCHTSSHFFEDPEMFCFKATKPSSRERVQEKTKDSKDSLWWIWKILRTWTKEKIRGKRPVGSQNYGKLDPYFVLSIFILFYITIYRLYAGFVWCILNFGEENWRS